MKHYIVKDKFFSEAKNLRKVFEDRFKDPRKTNGDRFVWDYWYVQNQYQLVRTPAYHYFPEKMFKGFEDALVKWGRETLGCHSITPPWLSYYVDGCHQGMHSDVPHGPWAYVFSLTPKIRKFKGGETLILRPDVLNYWQNFADDKDREADSFLEKITAEFNRLIVFDPRFPHGVTEVEGTRDPMEARLVIHGWFVEPRPYVVGPLSTTQVQVALDDFLYQLGEFLPELGDVHGTISLRAKISASGVVSKIDVLTNTVVAVKAIEQANHVLVKFLLMTLKQLKFPKKTKDSVVVIPLLFK